MSVTVRGLGDALDRVQPGIPPDRGGGHRPRGGFEPLGLDGVAHLLAVPSLGDNPASSRTASREKQPLSTEQLPSCVVTLCGDPDPHEGLPRLWRASTGVQDGELADLEAPPSLRTWQVCAYLTAAGRSSAVTRCSRRGRYRPIVAERLPGRRRGCRGPRGDRRGGRTSRSTSSLRSATGCTLAGARFTITSVGTIVLQLGRCALQAVDPTLLARSA